MNLNNLLQGLASSGVASGLAGGLAGGALSGALMSKKGREYAGTALQVGGVAAIGGLAWNAYQKYRDGQFGATPQHSAVGQSPARAQLSSAKTEASFQIDEADTSEGSRGLLLIRAMIAAAAADGHMDPQEKTRIFAKVDVLNLSGSEKALLFDELARPASLVQVVSSVKDMETAVEVYAASLLAVDESRTEGQIYLAGLADRLGLPPPLVQEIHAQGEEQHQAA